MIIKKNLFIAGSIVLLGLLCVVPALAQAEKSVADIGKELTEKYKAERPTLWSEHQPGIVDYLPLLKNEPHKDTFILALTLDACAGGTDKLIITLLREHKIPVTVFVTNRWLETNMDTARELANDPLFTLASHGELHKPASVDGKEAYGITGTKNIVELVKEVENNARAIEAITGRRPNWYRTGTAFYDDVALKVIADLGFSVAGFAISADRGATLPAEEVSRAILEAPNRSIILCHINKPESGTYAGLASAIPLLIERDVKFISLDNDYR